MNKIPLVTIEYSEINKQPHIVLFVRENRIRKKIVAKNFIPYFYVPINEHPLFADINQNLETFKTLDGETCAKYYTKTPSEVIEARKMFSKTWEADVRFTSRFLIDEVPQIEKTELRIQYTDIETDIQTNQIISIATYDNYLNKVVCFAWKEGIRSETTQETFTFPSGYQFKASVRLYNSKESMLGDYVKFIQETDPDILTGWYFLDFDMPRIVEAIDSVKGLSSAHLSPMGTCYVNKNDDKQHYEPNVTCKGRVLWDMLEAYKKLQPTGLPSKSLEAISQKELGEGKKPLEHSISWLWKNNLKTLVEYNAKDSILVYRIDEKNKIIDYYDSLRRQVGCEWSNIYSSNQKWDIKILRKMHGKVALPTKKRIEITRIKGAEVFLPATKGIKDWVVLLDLKGLYPSIIVSLNLSPETFVKSGEKPLCRVYNLKNGLSFKSQPIGIIPSCLLELAEEREKYKKEMKKYPFGTDEYDVYDHLQTGVKVMRNSLYGDTLYGNFRLASREVGESTTFIGRTIIIWTKQKLEQMGFKVIYGDTDSIFYLAKKQNFAEIIEEMHDVVKELNEGFKGLIEESGGDKDKSQIVIEPKKIYRQFLIAQRKGNSGELAKKRYAGRLCFAKLKRNKVWLSREKNIPIADVKVGDKLIAYDFKNKKFEETEVKEIFERKCNDYLRIEIEKNKGKRGCMPNGGSQNPIMVTKEHPFLVKNRWISAKNLEEGDELFFISKNDKQRVQVSTNPEFKKRLGEHSVANTSTPQAIEKIIAKDKKMWKERREEFLGYAREGIKKCHTPEAEEKRTKHLFERGHYKRVSDRMKENNPMNNLETRHLAFLRRTTFPSYLEKLFIDLFKEENLPIEYVGDGRLWIGNLERDEKGRLKKGYKRMNPDFIIKDQKKVLEVYGYGYLKTRGDNYEKDRKEHYGKYGYKCLVLPINPRRFNKTEILEKIIPFLHNGVKITNIRGSRIKNVSAINFHCEPYNNFFVNGVLVHNCWNDGREVDDLDVMGFEARRSNSSELSRELQKKVLKVLFGFEPLEKLKVYIQESKYSISSIEPDLNLISIAQSITQPLNEYKTDNPWRRGSIWSNEYLGTNIGVGDKPKILYVKRVPQGYPKTDVVAFLSERDVPKGFIIDTEKMFEKNVVSKLEQILDAANMSFDEIFNNQSKLSSF